MAERCGKKDSLGGPCSSASEADVKLRRLESKYQRLTSQLSNSLLELRSECKARKRGKGHQIQSASRKPTAVFGFHERDSKRKDYNRKQREWYELRKGKRTRQKNVEGAREEESSTNDNCSDDDGGLIGLYTLRS